MPRQEQPDLEKLGGPGERLGDFELITELGRGSFGRVFLAQQLSLNRPVALKISATISHEARALASLEHPHIVPVFGESIDQERHLRLLCMRYIAGSTLERALKTLAGMPFAQRSGARLLEAVAAGEPGEESPLCDCDFVEAVCWIGARIAEALAFAHGKGVLHRDIKPANVLIDRQGRPLLADFNLAFDPRGEDATGCGGTRAYMAPEHLAAFEGRAPAAGVGERSDIFALGVVLFELLTGARPTDQSSPRSMEPAVPHVLDRTIRHCLEPDPGQRYQTAAELARALEGCREWHRSHKELPPAGPLTRATYHDPRLFCVVLPLLPQLVAAVVDLTYNHLWLSSHPEGARWHSTFTWLALGYTAAALVATGWAAHALCAPLWQAWDLLRQGADMDADRLAAVRRWAVRIPLWALVLSCLGWLPGGILVPLVLAALVGPVGGEVFLHLGLSFTLAGLIALTYTVYVAIFVVFRVGYPELWSDAQRMWQTASTELAALRKWLGGLQMLAGLVPLTAGAALLLSQIGGRPEQGSAPGYRVFQVLLLTLILLGMVGSGLAAWAHSYLQRTLAALTGDSFVSGRRPR